MLNSKYKVDINGFIVGECIISHLNVECRDTHNKSIEGVFFGQTILGDRSIYVDSVKFAIPNLIYLVGDSVKKKTKKGMAAFNNRLSFDTKAFDLTLDYLTDDDGTIKQSTYNGRSLLVCVGSLRKKSLLSLQETHSFFEVFNVFLSFINGRKTAGLLFWGISHHDITEPIWRDYTNYMVEPNRPVGRRVIPTSHEGLNGLLNNMYEMWKVDNDKGFLKLAIHWYNQVNICAGGLEGSIIMAQAALELIYNWVVIEQKSILKERNDSICAALST